MKRFLPLLVVTTALSVSAQDKYTLKVPGGLAFSEFKGYEDWQPVGPSETDAANVIRLIVANPVMINAYREGVPGNGKPFPDGSKIAKIEWRPKKLTEPPFSASTPDTVPGDLTAVEFIVKDSKRFSDADGWGFAYFDYDSASSTFAPATTASQASPRARRQVRHRVSHVGGFQGLHFHGISQEVARRKSRAQALLEKPLSAGLNSNSGC
jgi:cytochrome P460